jgi:hypothetical protein
MKGWTSRKWLLTLANEAAGGITALLGGVYGDEKVLFGGLGYMILIALGYLKAEKDIDAARAGAPVVYDYDKEYPCDCPACTTPKE